MIIHYWAKIFPMGNAAAAFCCVGFVSQCKLILMLSVSSSSSSSSSSSPGGFRPPLHSAIQLGHHRGCAEALLDSGCHLTPPTTNLGMTQPLHLAPALAGRQDLGQLLLIAKPGHPILMYNKTRETTQPLDTAAQPCTTRAIMTSMIICCSPRPLKAKASTSPPSLARQGIIIGWVVNILQDYSLDYCRAKPRGCCLPPINSSQDFCRAKPRGGPLKP